MELGDTYKRLPVYLLIDTSASMAGAPITAVNEGLRIFESIIRNDPPCRESVHASVIRFASDATQVLPLTEAGKFSVPTLAAAGGTALSKGLVALRDALDREIKPRSGDYPGDYRALVFLLTDGQPNQGDPWREEMKTLSERKGRRPGLFVAIGAGPEADGAMLRELAPENAHMLVDLDTPRIKALFEWMAHSTVTVSRAPAQLTQPSPLVLAAAPPNLFSS